jgi:hypothetical protein
VRNSDARAAISAQSRIACTSSARISSCGSRACSCVEVVADRLEALEADLHLARDLGRLQVVVDHAAQLVFDLVRRQAVPAQQRRPDTLALTLDLASVHRRKVGPVFDVAHAALGGQPAVDEGAQHVVVRHAGHVARRMQPGHRGARMLVDPDTRGRVAAAQADLGDVHLDHALAVVGAAAGVEAAATRPLVGVQDRLDRRDRFLGQVVELQEHRALAALQFLEELPHHLAAPVVALDEALAFGVGV